MGTSRQYKEPLGAMFIIDDIGPLQLTMQYDFVEECGHTYSVT